MDLLLDTGSDTAPQASPKLQSSSVLAHAYRLATISPPAREASMLEEKVYPTSASQTIKSKLRAYVRQTARQQRRVGIQVRRTLDLRSHAQETAKCKEREASDPASSGYWSESEKDQKFLVRKRQDTPWRSVCKKRRPALDVTSKLAGLKLFGN